MSAISGNGEIVMAHGWYQLSRICPQPAWKHGNNGIINNGVMTIMAIMKMQLAIQWPNVSMLAII
jgi:hypothetical protein